MAIKITRKRSQAFEPLVPEGTGATLAELQETTFALIRELARQSAWRDHVASLVGKEGSR
jgi:hypothetical protein